MSSWGHDVSVYAAVVAEQTPWLILRTVLVLSCSLDSNSGNSPSPEGLMQSGCWTYTQGTGTVTPHYRVLGR